MDKLINTKMEAAVLGTILYDNSLLFRVSEVLTGDCFADELNRDIFDCIRALMEEGEKATPVRLWNKFSDRVGESSKNYLSSLTSQSAPLAFIGYSKHLADLSQRRALIRICNAAIVGLENFEKSGAEQASEIIEKTTKVLTATAGDTSITILEVMEGIYKRIASGKPSYVAKTGIRVMDAGMGGGLQQGKVYAFMAPAKCGKTMMATTISNNLNAQGHKHLYVCAEMGSNEICERILGQRLCMPVGMFIDPGEALQGRILDEMAVIKNNTIFEDVPGVEFDALKTLIEKHVYKNKIEGFILDYYQLVGGVEKGQTQAQHLENVANWVHRVCKKHKIWCILLVQTNDELKVLGSRGLNRACDQGYLIERPLDEQDDPIGSVAWLKLRFSRYTKTYNFGSQDRPCLEIHKNGTHFVEI